MLIHIRLLLGEVQFTLLHNTVTRRQFLEGTWVKLFTYLNDVIGSGRHTPHSPSLLGFSEPLRDPSGPSGTLTALDRLTCTPAKLHHTKRSCFHIDKSDTYFAIHSIFLLCPSHKVLPLYGICLRPVRGSGQVFRCTRIVQQPATEEVGIVCSSP